MNRNGWLGRLAYVSFAAGGALMVFEACSDPMGGMLVDAGTALVDAGAGSGGSLADAGELIRDAGMALTEAGSDVRDGGAGAVAQGAASQFKSGSRIEMRVPIQKGGDGSQYAGYPAPYDTERKEACSPTKMTDGSTRCVPTGLSVFGRGSYFADAGCSKPMALRMAPCSASPAYASETVGAAGACSSAGTRIYKLGSKIPEVYTGTPANCTASDPYKGTGYSYYAVGAEIPPSAFVEFTTAT